MLNRYKISWHNAGKIQLAILSGLILLCFTVQAQTDSIAADHAIRIDAILIDSASWKPVQFAHIVNTNLNSAAISDTLGYFHIRAYPGDTINISAIGYTFTQFIPDHQLIDERKFITLYMKPYVYSIRSVSVNQLGSYDQFKQKFLSLTASDLPRGLHPSVMKDINEDLEEVAHSSPKPIASPVSFFYMLWSKEGKSSRKLARLMEEEEFRQEIAYKFNPAMVSKVTGYGEAELYEFMEFCNFKKKFLLEANDYTIVEAILNKQKVFEELKER